MTSTKFNVGMSLDRASSKVNRNNESNSDDCESDEDYVPSKEQQTVSEEDSDEPVSDYGAGGQLIKCHAASKNCRKRMKKGDAAIPQAEPNVSATSNSSTNIDDIWNKFIEECEETKTKPSESKEKEGENILKTKIVTEIFEFAGEAVEIRKEVVANAPEPPKASRPVAPRRGGGLTSVLGQIGKKNKLSVLEKTKLDWDNYKKETGISEDLASHNKGKNGYLEKQDFLQRADVRQFEIEKAMRSSRRLK